MTIHSCTSLTCPAIPWSVDHGLVIITYQEHTKEIKIWAANKCCLIHLERLINPPLNSLLLEGNAPTGLKNTPVLETVSNSSVISYMQLCIIYMQLKCKPSYCTPSSGRNLIFLGLYHNSAHDSKPCFYCAKDARYGCLSQINMKNK